MLNSTIVIKIKQRINKLDSQDYDNITCWQIVEAFNKAQVEWTRRQLHGINLVKERIKLFSNKNSNFIKVESEINQGTKVTLQITININ